MEAGYDYLLVNRRFRLFHRIVRSVSKNPLPYAGATLVALGLIGVLIGSLFFFVFDKSTEELKDDLNVVAEATPAPAVLTTVRPETVTPPPTPPPATAQPAVQPPAPQPVAELSGDLAPLARLYPGEGLKASCWTDPSACEPSIPVFIDDVLPRPLVPLGQLPAPTRLIIPSIDVDSDIKQLRILDLGNSRAYETPSNVVGHIPASANPGEAGSTWLFGHLESPIRGEGNVFAQLPEIPSMLRRGDEVFVVVENGSESYVYRIVESKVVPQEELSLTGAEGQLLMVTCVPRFIYDHRLIVRGVLEGVKS